jgi:hypothetical protein
VVVKVHFLTIFSLIAFFLVPHLVSAAGTSFGGRVVTVIPCVSALGPSLHVSIIPVGLAQPFYIWTPLTLTFLYGPPRNPGQQVLGVADIPYVCFVGKAPLYGQRMQIVGTSPLI